MNYQEYLNRTMEGWLAESHATVKHHMNGFQVSVPVSIPHERIPEFSKVLAAGRLKTLIHAAEIQLAALEDSAESVTLDAKVMGVHPAEELQCSPITTTT